MSPMWNELEMGASPETLSLRHTIHEYAFGIISSDSRGLASMVSISEPYKKLSSGSTGSSSSTGSAGDGNEDEEDLLNSVAFQNWSMSSYQSHSFNGSENEDEDDHDQFKEDDNNNLTRVTNIGSTTPKLNRLKRSNSDMKDAASPKAVSSPRKIPQLPRRWSGGSFFGGTPSPPVNRCRPLDPDMPAMDTPSESWISSITSIPDRIRKHKADKNRFNVNSVSRDKLKQLQCY